MRPFSALVLVVVIGAMMSFSSPASAVLIFQDDFEGHAAGTDLTAITPTIGASYGDNWNIQVWDALTDPPAIAPPGGPGFIAKKTNVANVSMYISAADQTAVTGKVVNFNFDTYVVSDTKLGGGFVTFLPGYVRGWNIELADNGTIRYYNSDLADPYPDAGVTYRLNRWIPVEVVADYGNHTFHATVDGNEFDGDWAAAGASSFERLYMAPVSAQSRFYVDNLSISVVPEPSSLALIATALLGLVPYARRKRR